MDLFLLAEMAASSCGERTAITMGDKHLSFERLAQLAQCAGAVISARRVPSVLYVGPNSLAFPVGLFGAAWAGVPLVPLNYRLGVDQLGDLIEANPKAMVIYHGEQPAAARPNQSVEAGAFLASLGAPTELASPGPDPEKVAVQLYTSGTTAIPKAIVLRHRHLMAYILGTVEFGSSEPDEKALVSVPPYHIAGLANLLSNLYAGRQVVYLSQFDPGLWLEAVRSQSITQAMVVPTMLARIVSYLGDANDAGTPNLRNLSYGGSRMPLPVIERALELFGSTGFVNAYGLTETSSTIAVLGPQDHRDALSSDDPATHGRLASVGHVLGDIEIEVRGEDGSRVGNGEVGLVYLRGEQISGESNGVSVLDPNGWFPTGDRGYLDAANFLFIEGRADDTIIRGGENIAPAEIEDVLMAHADIVDAVVVGVADQEWGQRLVAVVVKVDGSDVDAPQLQAWCRTRLRSSKMPSAVEFRSELPRTDTGKLLRRQVLAEITV